ncbi:MAG: MliC family protein [Deltaproteobacteria bacterium]|nr:MliC family protein [Deltaproteobacteria bacterium]
MGEVLRRLAVVVVIAGVFTLSGCVSSKPSGKSSSINNQPGAVGALKDESVIRAIFISEQGARLKASFDTKANTVTITLPSGNETTLPRAISGSGARYSNERETFWEHHGEASYWIGGKRVFQGKVEESK